MIAIVTLLIISMTAIGWITSSQWRLNRQRSIVASKPFPTLWRNILKKRFPYFKAMPTDLQLQLKKHIQVFISEKQFVGCDGFDINDEVKVTIAAQACLLLLNRKTDYYPKLKQILVYPSAFIVHQNRTDIAGVYSTQRNVLLGESWEYGKVVLSWNSTVEGAADPLTKKMAAPMVRLLYEISPHIVLGLLLWGRNLNNFSIALNSISRHYSIITAQLIPQSFLL